VSRGKGKGGWEREGERKGVDVAGLWDRKLGRDGV